jgi:hypothetical protein
LGDEFYEIFEGDDSKPDIEKGRTLLNSSHEATNIAQLIL